MDDETIKYSPLPEEPIPVGPKKERPRKQRKERAHSEEVIPMSRQEDFVAIALEEIQKDKQEGGQQEKSAPGQRVSAIDVFTHSKTGFPGAWPEEEVVQLLNAWETAMDALRAAEKPFNVTNVVMETLQKNGFREVRKYEVWKQMQKLRTEYKTYRGLQALGLETVKAECVPQMMRIFRKRTNNRRNRRRRTSTASYITGVSEDLVGQDEAPMKPDSTDQAPSRNRRMGFQGQNLQRSIRVMVGQQKAILDYLQSVSKALDESNSRVIGLLEQLVGLQRN